MAEPAYPLILPEDDGQAWPAQGSWTYEDYLRLPDDGQRYEVIRGFLYVSPAPSLPHQYSVTQLGTLLNAYVKENRLGMVLVAPLDIRLPEGLGNPVQPDVLFIRRDRQPRAGALRFDGVPDLAVEVLSPGNWRFDRTIKLAAYRDAGIPETWLADLTARTIEVFVLEPDRPEYVLRERRGEGETVGSTVLPGLRLEVAEIFFPSADSEES
ncbi:MAG TPA: Uma2 family endonuclease [Thermoanaerobaculia bacterium]|nr:Uma2 family endonuclease [Thermoanaerobaculia bacterium]